jgi:hypothetical protein
LTGRKPTRKRGLTLRPYNRIVNYVVISILKIALILWRSQKFLVY